MKITELIIEDIYKYMVKNKINISKIIITKNGSEPYKATSEEATENDLNKFNNYMQKQTTVEKKLDLLVKYHFGTWAGMDRSTGIRGNKEKYKRLIRKNKEMWGVFNCESSIKSK